MAEARIRYGCWQRVGVYVAMPRFDTAEDAWAGHLPHGRGPPRQTA